MTCLDQSRLCLRGREAPKLSPPGREGPGVPPPPAAAVSGGGDTPDYTLPPQPSRGEQQSPRGRVAGARDRVAAAVASWRTTTNSRVQLPRPRLGARPTTPTWPPSLFPPCPSPAQPANKRATNGTTRPAFANRLACQTDLEERKTTAGKEGAVGVGDPAALVYPPFPRPSSRSWVSGPLYNLLAPAVGGLWLPYGPM